MDPQAFLVFDWLFSKKSSPLKLLSHKQEWPVAAMFVNGSGRNEQFL
jgi:hypothetical protein